MMVRDAALAALRAQRRELQQHHVARVALFGSVAQGEATAGSDVDVLIEFEPGARVTLYDYAAVKRFVRELLGGHVDVIDRANLNRHIRAEVEQDAVYAF
jgi:predicted nucleotidyltransferase